MIRESETSETEEPYKFEQFLRFLRFQKLFQLQHFHIGRDEFGRLHNKTKRVFYSTAGLHVCFFVGILTEVVKEVFLNLPSNPNLPALFIGIFFSVRGVMLFVKHDDIIAFLNVLDQEFPRDLDGQKALCVPEFYERSYQRYRYVENFMSYSQPGFFLAPPVVYAFTRDVNGPIREEQQILGGWLPFGIRENHNLYFCAWLYDFWAAISGVSYFCSFDAIFNSMILQIIMHLDHLASNLKSLDLTGQSDSQIYQQLCRLIHRHQQLNSLCDTLNSIFNVSILMTNFVAAASICFHLYLVTETQDVLIQMRYAIVGSALVGFTYEICLRGTQLQEASSQLNEVLYNQSWYVCDKKSRKLILMWLKYTQCTKNLNAYGLMELNMVHFSDIMKLAYKLFTFLKSA